MKRTTSLLILAAMFMSLASCGGGSGSTETTTAPTETTTAPPETSYLDTLPEEDFDGESFVIMGQHSESRKNFYMEELDGDVINDAIYQRDIAVSDRLNITLEYIAYTDRGQVTPALTNAVLADEESYHLAMQSLSDGINTWTGAGVLYDLTKLPYITLDSVRWNPSMLENMDFNGALYFTTGAITPMYYMTPIVMAMNKELAEDYQIPNIYDTVLDGKWTVDLLHSYTKDISRDLNNDGKMDGEDFYGLVVDGTFGGVLYNSAGINPIDENYNITLGSAQSVDIVDKLSNMFGSRDVVFNDAGGAGTSGPIFREGNALFLDNTVLGIASYRDIEFDFAIIPSPKYDESQEKYYTTCNTWLASGLAVPINCSNPERTGLILETMAYYSNELITPAIYEVTLQGKVSRDDESSRMLDIIFENSYFDMITAFNFNNIAVMLREIVLGERENFVSQYATISPAAQAALDTIVENATK